ncbi:MAG: hypothetical protein KGV58_01050 [Campylobacteraceae bacterium]|nr:hypothetical protein [Campylobacteraceae bacterium]
MNKKGFEREKNLSKNIYFSDNYFDKQQLFVLSEQIVLIYKYTKKIKNPILVEIGKGNGFVSDFFKKAGFDFLTFDINKNLNPDIEGNILAFSNIVTCKPDIVVACEILEHMPFEVFEYALEQISKVARKYVIITLPEFKKFFGANFQIKLPKKDVFSFPLHVKVRGDKILGSGHFWEIDFDEQSKRENVENVMKKYFQIEDKGSFGVAPYHNYYVLKV